MKYTIPKANLKIFHKALQCIGKVGSDLLFEPSLDKLQIKALNSSRTAIFIYSFNASFFSSVDSCSSLANPEAYRCKVQLKSVLLAFQSVFGTDKSVESCMLEFVQDSSALYVYRLCRLEVCAKFKLPTLVNDDMRTDFTDTGKSYWMLPSKVLAEVVGTFRTSQEEATISVSNKGFQMKSHVLTFEDKEQANTELSMLPEEFEDYSIEEETSLTFSLKELRSLIGFAEAADLPVKATFSTGGNPIAFLLNREPMEVIYALSTMPDDEAEPDRVRANGDTSRRADTSIRSIVKGKVIRNSTQVNSLPPMECLATPALTPILNRSGATSKNQSVDELQTTFTEDNRSINQVVPTSPVQSRRRPALLSKCFDKTFIPSKLQPGTRILAGDSDEEDK